MKTKLSAAALGLAGLMVAATASPGAAATGEVPELKVANTSAGVVVEGKLLKADPRSGLVQTATRVSGNTYAYVASSATVTGDAFPELTLTATEKGVQLNWGAVDGAKKYSVYRSGKLLKQTDKLTWTDKTTTPGSSASYTVETVTPRKPQPKGGRFENVPVVNEGGPATPGEVAPTAAAVEPKDYSVVIARDVTVPATNSQQSVKAAIETDQVIQEANRQVAAGPGWQTSNTGPTSVMRHTTFIPNDYVSVSLCNPVGYTKGELFGGNNRGYSITSESYKTRMNVYFYWDKNAIGAGVTVKPSNLYNKNHQIIDTRTASGSGITATRWYPAGYPGYTHFWVQAKHNATNPFCENTAAPISYAWDARVDESGAYAISGWHDNAPSHEIYYGRHWAGDNAAGWQVVHQAPLAHFYCLYSAGPCQPISISNGIGDPRG